jgi:hypothetical protein
VVEPDEKGLPGFIRQQHPYGFRSGHWAQVIGTSTAEGAGCLCWLVVFPDGRTDCWPVEDPSAGYEFADTAPR